LFVLFVLARADGDVAFLIQSASPLKGKVPTWNHYSRPAVAEVRGAVGGRWTSSRRPMGEGQRSPRRGPCWVVVTASVRHVMANFVRGRMPDITATARACRSPDIATLRVKKALLRVNK
jgi:hypothetical protein